MALPVVVPDASVVLKWLLPSTDEPDADKALALLDAMEADALRVLLPSLWFYEVGNTIARRFPRKAAVWLTTLENLALGEAPRTPRWLAVALSLADLHGVTFYDAAYHATALAHGGVFITADRRYVERAGEAGGVVALSDWTPA